MTPKTNKIYRRYTCDSVGIYRLAPKCPAFYGPISRQRCRLFERWKVGQTSAQQSSDRETRRLRGRRLGEVPASACAAVLAGLPCADGGPCIDWDRCEPGGPCESGVLGNSAVTATATEVLVLPRHIYEATARFTCPALWLHAHKSRVPRMRHPRATTWRRRSSQRGAPRRWPQAARTSKSVH